MGVSACGRLSDTVRDVDRDKTQSSLKVLALETRSEGEMQPCRATVMSLRSTSL